MTIAAWRGSRAPSSSSRRFSPRWTPTASTSVQYDANGDGDIDAINLFYAGSTSCGWAKGMWPGAGGMSGVTLDGKNAARFQITGMGSSLAIGTFCHENGHMICFFPDLYDYDGDSMGVGNYDIMCIDNDNNPLEPSAWCKYKAGWESITDLTTKATGINLPVSSGNTCFRWKKNATEYYLIENRQKTGRDATISDAGLALWHVDEGPNGDHSWQDRLPNKHYLLTLVQADGDWDLENNTNSGDSGDLYAAPNDKAADGLHRSQHALVGRHQFGAGAHEHQHVADQHDVRLQPQRRRSCRQGEVVLA
jgi:hypothetical protein